MINSFKKTKTAINLMNIMLFLWIFFLPFHPFNYINIKSTQNGLCSRKTNEALHKWASQNKENGFENMLAMTLYASAQGDSQTVTVDLTA